MFRHNMLWIRPMKTLDNILVSYFV
ncbi:hypothetical protein CAEBREN_11639 [Caenorhabditis brenneri]|uniref:Uncharacterized protein n=1 Tax=Caenorhabditis brenneri TaxID=135651 RepID=G0MRJ7_CAEBE|nr:hypothetical protein CAEBREN_11639 [Caenorhabditis brenneri]